MAILGDLLVQGRSRFLQKIYAASLDIGEDTTIAGTLTLSKTNDAVGTSNNSPALVVGGTATTTHLELDSNEIMAKANDTTVAPIYINPDGGVVYISNTNVLTNIRGNLSVAGTSSFTGATTHTGNLTVSGTTSLAGTSISSNLNVANNAKVNGVLTVEEEIRSPKWIIDNIANLGGEFIIAPTIVCENNTSVNVSEPSNNLYTITVTDGSITSDTFGGIAWSTGSVVKVSGTINDTILVSVNGTMTRALNQAVGTIQFTISSNNITLTAGTYTGTKVKNLHIMMYKVGNVAPVGIFMTSYGQSHYPYIDIYSGTTSGSFYSPTTRLGYLNGLTDENGNALKINDISPTGWGLYTSNGYFSGTIVSTSGKIGGFTLNTNAIYNGTTSLASTNAGVYLGTTGIRNYKDNTHYVNIQEGVITALGANITGAITATSGEIGGFAIDSSSIHTKNVAVTSNADNSISLSSTDFTRTINSTSRAGLRFAIGDKFGITGDGILYTNGANITNINASNISTGTVSVGVLPESVKNENIEVGGRNLLLWTGTLHKGTDNSVNGKDGIVAWGNALSLITETQDGIKLTAANNAQECIGIPLANNGSVNNNEKVLLTFEARGNITSVGTFYWIQASGANVAANSWLNGSSSITLNETTWTKFIIDVTNSQANIRTCTKILIFYNLGSTNNGKWVEIKKKSLKLEKGNKATDWTPAPEDQEALITNTRTWYATCSTAAATTAKEATTTDSGFVLKEGVVVDVKFTNTNTGAVESLTLNVNGTGAKSIKTMYSNSLANITDAGQLYAGLIIRFVYSGTYWIAETNYNSDSNALCTKYYNTIIAGNGITAESIIGGQADGKFYQIKENSSFDLAHPLLWTTAGISSGGTNYSNIYTQYYDRNLGTYYTSFTNTTKNCLVYLVGTVSGNTFTTYGANSASYLTVTPPTTADGRFYIPIGRLGNSSNGKNYFNFQVSTPVALYAYIDGKFRQVTPTDIVATQRIYYRSNSSTKPNDTGLPTTWVTENGNKFNTNATTATGWSRKVSPMTSDGVTGSGKYIYLWTCEQRKRLDGTIDYTEILLDDSTTIIDGGNIITGSIVANKIQAGSITADRLNTTSINSSGILTLNAFASTTQSDILNSNVEVGGRNLLLKTNGSTTMSENYRAIYEVSSVLKSVAIGDFLTIAFDVKSTKAQWIDLYFRSDQNGGTPYTSEPFCPSLHITDIDTWYHYEYTSTIGTNVNNYNWFTLRSNSSEHAAGSVQGTVTIKNVKLEKGNKVTDWTPAPEDVDASLSLKANKDTLTTEINASADTVKIDADRVNIEGAAIFSSGRLSQTSLNNAYDAKGAATTAYNEIKSMGEQLIVNGNGFLGDNTNFTALTFDGSVSNNSPGSFTRSTIASVQPFTNYLFPVDPSKTYACEFDVKCADPGAQMYAMLTFYDADKLNIIIQHVSFITGSTTTLAQPLNNGDTKVYLTSAAGFTNTTAGHQRSLIFWNYTNSFGYTYPPETYSRNFKSDIWADDSSVDKVNNVITLKAAWTGGHYDAGTPVSQNHSGGTYCYFYSHTNKTTFPREWYHVKGYYSGIGKTGVKFWPGTAYCKIGWLWNYQASASSPQGQLWITNVSVKEDTITHSEVQTAIDTVSAVANAASPKTSANAREQIIYHSAGVNTTSMAATQVWVTDPSSGGGAQNVWTTIRPEYDSQYPVLFVATQRQTVAQVGGTTCTCTTPAIDKTTTVIDGGRIITGSVTANQLNATNINASKILTIGAMTDDTKSSILGGRNLATNTKNNINFTSSSATYFNPVGVYPTSNIGLTLLQDTSNTEFTLSFDWSAKDVTVAYNIFPALKYTSASYIRLTNSPMISIPIGTSSGHYEYTFTPTDAQRTYGDKWLLSKDSTNTTQCGTVTISHFMFECANNASTWTLAPEDIDISINTASQTATNYIYADSNGIKISQSNPSSATTNYMQITSNGIKTIYNSTYFTNLTSTGLKIHAGNANNPIASYGSSTIFYEPGTTTVAAEVDSNGINVKVGTFGNATNKITVGTGTSGHSAIRYGMTTLADTTNTGFYIGTDGIALGKGVFKVTAAGALTAKSGSIGKYTITDTYLMTGTGTSATGIGGNQAFWAGNNDSNNAPFRVSYAGALVSTSATITGTINATAGYFGSNSTNGWQIDSNAIKHGTLGSSGGYILNASGNSSATINGGARTNLALAIGSKFGVGNDGTLYTNGANITNINANNINAGTLNIGYLPNEVKNENISIGGKNLLRNSEVPLPSNTPYNNSNVTKYNLQIDGIDYYYCSGTKYWRIDFPTLISGETYNLWFDIARSSTSQNIYVKIGDSEQNVGTAPINSWIRLGLSFVASNTTTYAEIRAAYNSTSTNSDYIAALKCIKLEKGNKATDWTPAPEDQTAYVNDSIANIVVSSTNLIRNGDFSNGTQYWDGTGGTRTVETDSTFGYCLKFVQSAAGSSDYRVFPRTGTTNFSLTNGETYSISFYAKANAANTINCTRGYQATQRFVNAMAITTTWQRYTATFTANGSSAIDFSLGSAGTLYLTQVMLVHGDKPQDWSPDPRDVDSSISSAAKRTDVSVSVTAIDYSLGTATLQATLYIDGTVTTSNVTYKWLKDGSVISGQMARTLSVTAAMGLNHVYSCTVTYS